MSGGPDPRLLGLEPRAVEELLADLASKPPAGRPRLTLHLSSGREVSGELLQVSPGPGSRTLTLLCGREDVLWVGLKAVEAVTVHAATALVPRASTPSRLELRRRAAALAERVASGAAEEGAKLAIDLEWPAEDSEASRRGALRLVEGLEVALESVLRDAQGRRAVAAKLERIALGQGAVAGTRWEGRCFQLLAAGEGAPAAEAIRSALEAGL